MDALLVDAAERGDIDEVINLLKQGADIHTRSDRPLRGAALHGHLDLVKVLLDAGANLYARRCEAITYSAKKGHVAVVALLLEYTQFMGGLLHIDLALSHAVEIGNYEIVKLLVDAGADFTSEREPHTSPLYKAAEKEHIDIVMLFLERCDKNKEEKEVHHVDGIDMVFPIKYRPLLDRIVRLNNEMIKKLVACGYWSEMCARYVLLRRAHKSYLKQVLKLCRKERDRIVRSKIRGLDLGDGASKLLYNEIIRDYINDDQF